MNGRVANQQSTTAQAVWKSTTKVGMAVAKAADGTNWVVVRYSPPGNL
jgi:hypothetical protein